MDDNTRNDGARFPRETLSREEWIENHARLICAADTSYEWLEAPDEIREDCRATAREYLMQEEGDDNGS